MEQISSIIQRYYTKALENSDKTVYDLFKWTKRDVLLTDYKTGRVLCDMKDLEFPEAYSQQAADIIASKYFRKAGVNTPEGHETSMRQVAHRMVDFWVAALVEEGLVEEGDQSQILYDELVYGLLAQIYAPNSPQWFNTGLKRSYGIEGGQNELYYWDPEKEEAVESPDTYTRTQASACFILSIKDSLLGEASISDHYVTETRLFKGGSGTGTNFSPIRAEGEGLSGGGQSSGLMSFLKGLDRNAGAIKSGGTTRRAAKMVMLNIDHPEIEDFITWKAKEEDKVMALAKMGYDGDIDGEAYNTVSGQNSNNSVRMSDEFMQKVVNLDENPHATIELKGRVDDSVNRQVEVAKLWRLFNESAWRCADPAPQFDDTFNAWHTCPAGENGDLTDPRNRINGTNPCGEYAFLDDTSCNLASINVLKFYDLQSKHFDVEGYLHMISLCQLFLEASIVWGQFPTKEIARRTYQFRTTGLGMANLAALLMSVGLPYDSEEGRAIAAALAGTLTGQSYYVSSLMAEKVGPFSYYEINKPYMSRVMRNHARAAGALTDAPEGLNYDLPVVSQDLLEAQGFGQLGQALIASWEKVLASGEAHGFRNAQVSVMAPTGTISFAMDCASTSIEPFFGHVTYKKLSGGGYMKLANPLIENGLERLGYSADQRQAIQAYIMREEDGMIVDGKIEGAPYLREEDLAVFDTANTCGSGERYIAYTGHVDMVAAITPLISGAISKTVNLPHEATVEDFEEVVISSWEKGVKGITLYRDGSKFAQPLNQTLSQDQGAQRLEDLSYQALLAKAKRLQQFEKDALTGKLSRRDKPIGVRSGRTHPAQIEDVKIYTTVNRDWEGNITEIYITTDREGTLIMGLLNSLSKTISVMLQYHIPPQQIAKMLRGQKYEPYGFVSRHPYIKYVSSISDLISKIIDIETGDYSRVQIKPEPDDLPNIVDNSVDPELLGEEPETVPGEPMSSQVGIEDFIHKSAIGAFLNGEKIYDGSTCPNCSSTRMVRNGTCKVCLDCGTTTGCS